MRPKATNVVEIVPRDCNRVHIFALRKTKPNIDVLINVTSTSAEPLWKQLSPFYLSDIVLYDEHVSKRMENAWQRTKVYECHTDEKGEPTESYWEWANQGWNCEEAIRFPMGRGAKPLYSLWKGKKMDYITARKKIYCPLYAKAVVKTDAYKRLQEIYKECVETGKTLGLIDFDGWDYTGQINVSTGKRGYTLREVVEFVQPKMGHAFVLAGLLEGNHFWKKE